MQHKNKQSSSLFENPLRCSIKTKLILSVVSIILIIGFSMGILIHEIQKDRLNEQLRENGLTISKLIGESSIDPILHDDVLKLQNLMDATKNFENDVSYIFILDSKGNLIAHTFEDIIPIDTKNVNPINDEYNIKQLNIDGEYISDVAYPILDSEFGEVHVGMSQTVTRGLIQNTIKLYSMLYLVALGIGGLMAFFAGNIITKPIYQLEDGAKEFGKGNFDHEIIVQNNDEIGNLAHTLNNMAIKIQKLMYDQDQTSANNIESKNYLDAIVSGSHDPIFVLDSEKTIEFGNDAFFEFTGYNQNGIIGKSFMNLIPEEHKNAVLNQCNEAKMGIGKPCQTKANTTIITKCGLLKYIMMSHANVEFSDGVKFVVVARDMTEINKIDEMKNNIISNITHELRTPITITRGFIEVAMNENDPEIRNQYLERAKNAIDRQNRMVQDLIETAMGEMEHNVLGFEDIDFSEILGISLKDVTAKAKLSNINIHIQLEKNLQIKADKKQLSYVLTKLMDNAIKFTEKGGKLDIFARHKGEFIEICIKDTGIGILKENLDKIFDKFYQVDATTTRKYGGSGVGLTISKNIIEKHNGMIVVESEFGKGTTFRITLPKTIDK